MFQTSNFLIREAHVSRWDLDTTVQGCEDGSSSLRSEHSDPTHILGYIFGSCKLQWKIVTLGQSGLSLSQRDRDYLCSPLLDGLFTRLVAPDSPDSNTENGLLRLR